ncbi:rhamnogalacturonan lyase, partial [Bacillus subtilis]|nr:rhamnogalacturonan lyase [Bacillus subtilis]
LGHGAAMHGGDLDPSRKGLEVFQVHEDSTKPYGLSLRDAGTGDILWGVHAGTDVGRGMAAHIDPSYKWSLVWGIVPP